MARGGRSFAIQASDAAGNDGGGGGGGYTAQAVAFPATARLQRGGALTGVTGDYSRLLISLWTKRPPGYGEFCVSEANFMFSMLATDTEIAFAALTDAAINSDGLGAAYPEPGGWTHVLFSYDFDQQSFQLAVNGVLTGTPSLTNVSAPTLAGETDFHIGGGDGTDADLADLWGGFGQWLDLAVPANVAKFIAGGKPVDLGADGSTPTGTVPTLFFTGDATGFVTNRGTGGTFTLIGALTDASSSPSD